MRSAHRITMAVAFAVSAVAGTAAATQTVNLGADAKEAPPISAKMLAAQKAKLAAADNSIDTALAARPPALPKVPKFDPLGEPTAPPLVVTRVIPVASARTSSSDSGDDSAGRSTASRRTSSADPAPSPAVRSDPAPAQAPVHVDRDDDEDHGGDHAEEPRGSDSHDD